MTNIFTDTDLRGQLLFPLFLLLIVKVAVLYRNGDNTGELYEEEKCEMDFEKYEVYF